MKFIRSKWLLVMIAAVVAVAAGLVVIKALIKGEPVSRGKTVTEWVRDYGDTTNGTASGLIGVPTWKQHLPAGAFPLLGPRLISVNGRPVRNPGREAIQTIGRPAVPWLIKALQKPDTIVDRTYAPWWRSLSPRVRSNLPRPPIASAQVRRNAAEALGCLGALAGPAVPQLLETLCSADKLLRIEAAYALHAILSDDKGASPIRNLATRAAVGPALDPETAKALIHLESGGSGRLSRIVESLSSPHADVRHLAVNRLLEHGAAARLGLRSLIHLLDDPVPGVADAARTALARMRRMHNEVDFELNTALVNTRLNAAALRLIQSSDLASPEAIGVMRRILREGTATEKTQAAGLLGKCGAGAIPAVPELVNALKDSDTQLRYSAVCALEEIGPDASSALPALVTASQDNSDMVRNATRRALARIRQQSQVE